MIEERIAKKIFQLYRLIKNEIGNCFINEKLSLIQLHILFFIDNQKEVSHKQLATMLNVSLPTVTDLTDRLVDKGYLLRKPSETDRRIVLLKLTKKGDLAIKKLKEINCQKLKQRFGRLDNKEKEILFTLLKKLLENN